MGQSLGICRAIATLQCSHWGQSFSSLCLSDAVILAVLQWLNDLVLSLCSAQIHFQPISNITFYKITVNYAVALWGLTYFLWWNMCATVDHCCRIFSSGCSILWFFNLFTVQVALAVEWAKLLSPSMTSASQSIAIGVFQWCCHLRLL